MKYFLITKNPETQAEASRVEYTSLLQISSLHVTLCLLYPYYPRAYPNLYYFPSNSPPPKPARPHRPALYSLLI